MDEEGPLLPLDQNSIKGLRTRIVGNVVNFHPVVGSTSELAWEMASSGAEEGIVVISNKQTEGVGRSDRRWESPEGGLYLSLVLRPKVDPAELSVLPLMAGLCVSKAISTTYLMETSLKWPNDVLIQGRKVAGVLNRSSIRGGAVEHVIISIGINVNNRVDDMPPDIRRKATSIADVSGGYRERSELLRNLLTLMDLHYVRFLQGSSQQILEEWSDRSETIGREIRVQMMDDTIRGFALGIDEAGALMVKRGQDIIRVPPGDCIHLR